MGVSPSKFSGLEARATYTTQNAPIDDQCLCI